MNNESTAIITILYFACGLISTAQSGAGGGHAVAFISFSVGYTLGFIFVPFAVSASTALFRPKGTRMKTFHITYGVLGLIGLVIMALVVFVAKR